MVVKGPLSCRPLNHNKMALFVLLVLANRQARQKSWNWQAISKGRRLSEAILCYFSINIWCAVSDRLHFTWQAALRLLCLFIRFMLFLPLGKFNNWPSSVPSPGICCFFPLFFVVVNRLRLVAFPAGNGFQFGSWTVLSSSGWLLCCYVIFRQLAEHESGISI